MRLLIVAACDAARSGELLGLAGLPQPDLAARQRFGPGVHLHAPGSAWESLHVCGRSASHDVTARRTTDIGPRTGPRNSPQEECFPGSGRASGTRTLNQWVKSSPARRSGRSTCTDTTEPCP